VEFQEERALKAFLLIELRMAILRPLLNAVIGDRDNTHHHGGK
jgi:hypothetical protein